ncbi:hypothetical protein E2C01_025500 [Portunus trituberculatus]|uniref:Uncharacterized protein n=1 Tax=Portunus trituberculatus TaxID=210409 RepID=A0A5B7EGL9_PORTR|nr:hypothetical protein [Portunus trituberculatus]
METWRPRSGSSARHAGGGERHTASARGQAQDPTKPSETRRKGGNGWWQWPRLLPCLHNVHYTLTQTKERWAARFLAVAPPPVALLPADTPALYHLARPRQTLTPTTALQPQNNSSMMKLHHDHHQHNVNNTITSPHHHHCITSPSHPQRHRKIQQKHHHYTVTNTTSSPYHHHQSNSTSPPKHHHDAVRSHPHHRAIISSMKHLRDSENVGKNVWRSQVEVEEEEGKEKEEREEGEEGSLQIINKILHFTHWS